jgi:hypothetical protein
MIAPTDAERTLYADLTQLMMRMKGETLALVEAAIEERFQDFVRTHQRGRTARLEIVQTYIVHDEIEPWTEYQTEYRIAPEAAIPSSRALAKAPAEPSVEPRRIEAHGNVVPFCRAVLRGRASPQRVSDAVHPGGA